jgi:hypothetical protein
MGRAHPVVSEWIRTDPNGCLFRICWEMSGWCRGVAGYKSKFFLLRVVHRGWVYVYLRWRGAIPHGSSLRLGSIGVGGKGVQSLVAQSALKISTQWRIAGTICVTGSRTTLPVGIECRSDFIDSLTTAVAWLNRQRRRNCGVWQPIRKTAAGLAWP